MQNEIKLKYLKMRERNLYLPKTSPLSEKETEYFSLDIYITFGNSIKRFKTFDNETARLYEKYAIFLLSRSELISEYQNGRTPEHIANDYKIELEFINKQISKYERIKDLP